MREILRRHPITAALCAVGVLLALVIAAEVLFGMRRAPAGAAGTPGTPANSAFVEAKLMPSLGSASAEQAYPETGARPLFSPGRRPAPVLTASAAITRGQYVLQGVTIVGELRIALLKEKTGGRVFRVEKGRELNGITLAEVEADRVTLRSGSDSEVIPLNVQKGAAGSGAPTGAPAASGPSGPSAAAAGGPFNAPVAPPAAMPPPPAAAAPEAPRPAGGAQQPNSGLPNGGAADFGPRPRPAAPAQGAAGAAPEAAPMTAEELLARRRARRQSQTQ